MQLSYSQLQTWRRCRQKYVWRYIKKYQEPKPSLGQVRGDAGHAALAAWYSGESEAQALDVMRNRLDERARGTEITLDQIEKADALLTLVLTRYFEWSKDHNDWRSLVRDVEYRLDIPLPDSHTFAGYVDLVLNMPYAAIIEPEPLVWLVEHKFNQDADHSHLDMDTQCTLYCLAYWKQTGVRPEGVIYNTIRMREGGVAEKEPAKRSHVYRSKEGLELAWKELNRQAAEVSRARELLKPGVDNAIIYRNQTHDCHWDCTWYKQCLLLEQRGCSLPDDFEPRTTEIVLDE